jgi:hypothetical protein
MKKDFFDSLPKAFEQPAEETKPTEVVTEVVAPTEVAATEAKPAEVTDVKVEVKPTEVVTPTPEPKLDLAFFNKLYKTDFKSEEDIKGVIERSSKAGELENKLKEYDVLKADIEFYKKGINPLDWFDSEDDFRVQQFKKTNKDKDASIAYKLFQSDLSKVSDFDLIVQYELMNGGVVGGEPTAIEYVAKKYDIEDVNNPSEWDALTKTRLKRASNEVRNEIQKMKSEIKLPEVINLAEKREADVKRQAEELEMSKTGWTDVMSKLLPNLKEVEINDYTNDGKSEPLIKYVIEDDIKQGLGNAIMEHLVKNKVPINEANVKDVGTSIMKEYVWHNLPKILKAYNSTMNSILDKKRDEEIHNPVVLKTEHKPDTLTEEDKRKKDLTEMLIGKGNTFKYNKLF